MAKDMSMLSVMVNRLNQTDFLEASMVDGDIIINNTYQSRMLKLYDKPRKMGRYTVYGHCINMKELDCRFIIKKSLYNKAIQQIFSLANSNLTT